MRLPLVSWLALVLEFVWGTTAAPCPPSKVWGVELAGSPSRVVCGGRPWLGGCPGRRRRCAGSYTLPDIGSGLCSRISRSFWKLLVTWLARGSFHCLVTGEMLQFREGAARGMGGPVFVGGWTGESAHLSAVWSTSLHMGQGGSGKSACAWM